MNLDSLIGKIYYEKEFYELLLLDVEENFEQYSSKFIHFYFDRVENSQIKITQIVNFQNDIEIDNKNRSIIEKKEWFEISQNDNHFDLMFCRFDRTGFISLIFKDSTHTQEWKHGWADEFPDSEPMTPDEIRQAFFELSGILTDQQEKQKLISKKSI